MKMETEEEALVFADSPNYYVQSPSSVSHAHSSELRRSSCNTHEVLLLPYHSPLKQLDEEANYKLSRCSSSRASISSFVGDKKTMLPTGERDHNSLIIVNGGTNRVAANSVPKKFGNDNDGEEEDEDQGYYDEKGWWKYLSFETYASSVWICVQLLWRFLVSVMAALLVFYIATKPPPPHVSFKIEGVKQFELAEGVDSTGVSTNFLSCNISMGLVIDNKSKVFGLHILSPVVEIYFGRLPFLISEGANRLYAESHQSTELRLNAGVTTKPMYGAGRNMQDMLKSGKGLPLLVTLSFHSYYRVIASLVHPEFHHHSHCFLAIQNSYDKNHRTQAYNSTCFVTS